MATDPKGAKKDDAKQGAQQAPKLADGEPLRKITVKSVFGKIDIEEILAQPGKQMPIMNVWGVTSRMKPGSSDFGEYVRFIGQFKAANLKTQKLYRAPAMLLPRFLEEELAAAMSGAADGAQVAFAFHLYVKYDADAATKYIYHVESLRPAAETSAMSALEAEIGSRVKQLAAPAKAA